MILGVSAHIDLFNNSFQIANIIEGCPPTQSLISWRDMPHNMMSISDAFVTNIPTKIQRASEGIFFVKQHWVSENLNVTISLSAVTPQDVI